MDNIHQNLPSSYLQGGFDLPDAENIEVVVTDAVDTDLGNYHTFRVESLGFLLPHSTLSEMVENISYCRLPNTSNILVGMASLRGSIIPLFDLHTLLGSPLKKWHGRVLIIGTGADAVGVIVSELPRTVSIAAEHRLSSVPPVPESIQPYIQGCYENDGIWLRLDLFEFFESMNTYL